MDHVDLISFCWLYLSTFFLSWCMTFVLFVLSCFFVLIVFAHVTRSCFPGGRLASVDQFSSSFQISDRRTWTRGKYFVTTQMLIIVEMFMNLCWNVDELTMNNIPRFNTIQASSFCPFIPSTIMPLRCPSGYSHKICSMEKWRGSQDKRASSPHRIISSVGHRSFRRYRGTAELLRRWIFSCIRVFVQPLRHLNVSSVSVEVPHYDIIPTSVSVCCPVSVSGISGCECCASEHFVIRCFVVVVYGACYPVLHWWNARSMSWPVPWCYYELWTFACVLGVGEIWKIVVIHELVGTDHSTCKDYVELFFPVHAFSCDKLYCD